jgi:hypothetical protein
MKPLCDLTTSFIVRLYGHSPVPFGCPALGVRKSVIRSQVLVFIGIQPTLQRERPLLITVF